MKHTLNFVQRLMTAGSHRASMVVFAGLFGVLGTAQAAPMCSGGSVIYNSAHTAVGCSFSTWGPAEQSMCNGATVFAPSNSGPGTCHVCVVPPYDTQVSAGNYTGLTLQPAPGGGPTSFTCLKCAQPPSGMAAWWTLDDANTGSVSDLTGNISLPGLLYNSPQIVLGEVNSALHFNGANQYVQFPDDPQLNIPAAASNGSGDFSIDAWVKLDPSTATSGVRVIVEKRTSVSNQLKGYSFYLYNRYLGLQLADGVGTPNYANYGASTLVVPADGQWHFVAVTVSRSSMFSVQFTLDNQPPVVVNSWARTGSLTNTSPMRIGALTTGSGSVFNGSIDEVEFFRRAVTYAEWQTIYNAKCNGKCRP